MNRYTDLMLDLETFSTDDRAIVVSFAAVAFNTCDTDDFSVPIDPNRVFTSHLNIAEQQDAGRLFSGDTIQWWLKQGDDARLQIANGDAKPVDETLHRLNLWCKRILVDNSNIFGNGVGFDVTIMKSLYKDFDVRFPFKYWNHMDLRTLKAFPPSGTSKVKSVDYLTAHNPVHDCLFQIMVAQKCINVPKKVRKFG